MINGNKFCILHVMHWKFGPGPMASDAGRSKEGLGLVLDLADQDDVSLLGSLGPSAARSVKCACLAETQASPAPVLPMLGQPRTTPLYARQA